MIIQQHIQRLERLNNLYKVNPALRTEIDLFAKDLLTDCMIDFYRRYLDLDGKPIEDQVESYVQELNRDLS